MNNALSTALGVAEQLIIDESGEIEAAGGVSKIKVLATITSTFKEKMLMCRSIAILQNSIVNLKSIVWNPGDSRVQISSK